MTDEPDSTWSSEDEQEYQALFRKRTRHRQALAPENRPDRGEAMRRQAEEFLSGDPLKLKRQMGRLAASLREVAANGVFAHGFRHDLHMAAVIADEWAPPRRVSESATLEEVLLRERWCTRWPCTTCGAQPFRQAILEFAGDPGDAPDVRCLNLRSARRILLELREIDPATCYDAVVHLLRWIGTSVGEGRAKSALRGSSAGVLYEQMLDARKSADAGRAEDVRRNSPEFVVNERARKAAARAARHAERLAAKHDRDAERTKAAEILDDDASSY
jgi:hypothetical protein